MYKPMEQIQDEYNGYWVFMINCVKDEFHSVIGGEVIEFRKNMNEILKCMATYDNQVNSTYVRYIGQLPEGIALL